jgi:hypothetical protein
MNDDKSFISQFGWNSIDVLIRPPSPVRREQFAA